MKTGTRPRSTGCFLFISAVITALLCLPVAAQVRNAKKLSRLAPALRERLVKRLELFVQYDRDHEYALQYDLLSQSYLRANKLNPDTYVEFKHKEVRGTLLEVKIWDVDAHLKEGYVSIPVEAKTLYHGQMIKDSWIFTAYLQDGEWYFDYTWVDI